MQKYVITLLVVLFFSLYSKSTFSDVGNISKEEKKAYYNEISKALEGNKSLNDEYTSCMKKLETALGYKIDYERMLRVMNDVGNDMLLGYLKHEKIMPFVMEYQEAIKIMAEEKGVSGKVINNLLLEHYRDSYKGQILEIFEYYSVLAGIYDRIFLGNKGVEKEGKQEESTKNKLNRDKQYISLQFMDNIIIDEMLVLIPSKSIDTPYELTEHLREALLNNKTYMNTLLKAHTMTVYYRHAAIANQTSGVEMSKNTMCKLLESLTLTGIQAYKIILETDSQIVTFAQYDKGVRELLNKNKEEIDAVLKKGDEKIENLKKEIEKTSGLEKELKEDDLAWMELERSKKVHQLKFDQDQKVISSENAYNDAHRDLITHKKSVRLQLFALYTQITDLMNEKKPSIDAVKAIIDVLDHFADVFQTAVSGPKITSDNIQLQGGK